MYNKYLLLEFKSAKLLNSKNSKDFIIDNGNLIKRPLIKNFFENEENLYTDEILLLTDMLKNGNLTMKEKKALKYKIEQLTLQAKITSYQVSNVIHCILGERPVPSLRKCSYDKVSKYFDNAQKSYLYVSNEVFPEIKQTKKSISKSWSTNTHFHWEKIKQYLDGDKFGNKVLDIYQDFVNKLSITLGYNVLNKDFISIKKDTIELYNNKNTLFLSVLDMLEKNKKTALKEYLIDINNSGSDINKNINFKVLRNVFNGIETEFCYNGFILYPIDDDDIIRLSNISCGVATLLDDGLVFIKDIINDISDIKGKYNFKEVKIPKI